MKRQIGVIVPYLDTDYNTIDMDSFKQTYIDRYENVDSTIQKPIKLKFVEDGDDDGNRWVEVWEE